MEVLSGSVILIGMDLILGPGNEFSIFERIIYHLNGPDILMGPAPTTFG